MNYREEEENEAAAEEFAEARRTEEPITHADAIKRAEAALRKWETHLPLKLGRPLPTFDTIDCINALQALLASTPPEPAATRSNDPDAATKTMERLLQSVATAEKLKTKTNVELADLLLNHVWAECPLGSPQSDLLDEVLNRLRGLKTCAVCNGWGYVEHARCLACAGTGDVEPAPAAHPLEVPLTRVWDNPEDAAAYDAPPAPAAASEEAFAAFGRALLPKWWDDGNPGDIDGGDAQDAAEAAGLWHRVERHADGVECEWCNNEEPCGELTEIGQAAIGGAK